MTIATVRGQSFLLMGLGRTVPGLSLPPPTVGVEQTRLEFLVRTWGEGRPTSLGRLTGLELFGPSMEGVRALPERMVSQHREHYPVTVNLIGRESVSPDPTWVDRRRWTEVLA